MELPQDPARLSRLAADPATPPDVLERLAGSTLPFVREAVAVHPHSTEATLVALVPTTLDDEPSLRVASALASNPATPERALRTLSMALRPDHISGQRRERHAYQQAALLIVAHRRVTADVASRLLAWLPADLRAQCARAASNPDVLALLAADRSTTVRDALATRASPPK